LYGNPLQPGVEVLFLDLLAVDPYKRASSASVVTATASATNASTLNLILLIK
jgi:hypothetical protein